MPLDPFALPTARKKPLPPLTGDYGESLRNAPAKITPFGQVAPSGIAPTTFGTGMPSGPNATAPGISPEFQASMSAVRANPASYTGPMARPSNSMSYGMGTPAPTPGTATPGNLGEHRIQSMINGLTPSEDGNLRLGGARPQAIPSMPPAPRPLDVPPASGIGPSNMSYIPRNNSDGSAEQATFVSGKTIPAMIGDTYRPAAQNGTGRISKEDFDRIQAEAGANEWKRAAALVAQPGGGAANRLAQRNRDMMAVRSARMTGKEGPLSTAAAQRLSGKPLPKTPEELQWKAQQDQKIAGLQAERDNMHLEAIKAPGGWIPGSKPGDPWFYGPGHAEKMGAMDQALTEARGAQNPHTPQKIAPSAPVTLPERRQTQTVINPYTGGLALVPIQGGQIPPTPPTTPPPSNPIIPPPFGPIGPVTGPSESGGKPTSPPTTPPPTDIGGTGGIGNPVMANRQGGNSASAGAALPLPTPGRLPMETPFMIPSPPPAHPAPMEMPLGDRKRQLAASAQQPAQAQGLQGNWMQQAQQAANNHAAAEHAAALRAQVQQQTAQQEQQKALDMPRTRPPGSSLPSLMPPLPALANGPPQNVPVHEGGTDFGGGSWSAQQTAQAQGIDPLALGAAGAAIATGAGLGARAMRGATPPVLPASPPPAPVHPANPSWQYRLRNAPYSRVLNPSRILAPMFQFMPAIPGTPIDPGHPLDRDGLRGT